MKWKWEPHLDKELFDSYWPYIRLLQALAIKWGIPDIFQDNGGKTLQIILYSGIFVLPGRMGNDAIDDDQRQYEIKTSSSDHFSTSNNCKLTTIEKFRNCNWLFGIYNGIELEAIYHMEPSQLEEYFSKWETQLRENTSNNLGSLQGLNDPRIKVKYVRQHGHALWLADNDQLPFLKTA